MNQRMRLRRQPFRRLLQVRRMARLAAAMEPAFERLMTNAPWDTLTEVDESLMDAMVRVSSVMHGHVGAAVRPPSARWLAVYEQLGWQDRVAVIDAHLNRSGRPEVWVFRAGVIEWCEKHEVTPPRRWRRPQWPLNQTMPGSAGGTLLHEALRRQWCVVGQLLDWGADPNRCDAAGRTVLQAAVEPHAVLADRYHHLIEPLLARGARWDVSDAHGATPLDVALKNNAWGSALALIRGGAGVQGWLRELNVLWAFARQLGDEEGAAAVGALVERQYHQAMPPAPPTPGGRRTIRM